MPFFIYEVQKKRKGTTYTQSQKVSLAGNTWGMIYNTLIARGPIVQEWHVTEGDLLKTWERDPSKHALVIDLKPDVEGSVEMYRVRNVWGYSTEFWTPMLLELSYIYSDESAETDRSKAEFVEEFDHQVFEFLYLQGGTCRGTWNFPWGTITGALLFPGALDYFLGIIEKSRASR